MKTKDKILNAARNLFNEYGVPQVSLRRIASEIGISQGNLNYHFNKREDIFEALYFQLFDHLGGQADTNPEHFNLQAFLSDIRKGMEVLFDYRFLMIDLNHTMRENPKLHTHFKQLEQSRKEQYQQAFKAAIDHDIMRAPAFKDEYDGLIDRIRVFSDYWIASAAVYDEPLEGSVDKYHKLVVEMFFPYFTRDAQREFLLNQL